MTCSERVLITRKIDSSFTNHKTHESSILVSESKRWGKMDKLRLLLTLVTIAIVVVPLVGMVLAYQDNLVGLFIPPEMTEMAEDFFGGEGIDGSGIEPPTMVGEPEYNAATRTFSISFQFENPFPMDITIKSLTGNIECDEHRFHLGVASISEPVSIDAGETGTLTVLGTWTLEAISHFESEHGDEELVDAVLLDLVVDISGLQLELGQGNMEQSIQVPNPSLME